MKGTQPSNLDNLPRQPHTHTHTHTLTLTQHIHVKLSNGLNDGNTISQDLCQVIIRQVNKKFMKF